MTLMDLKEQLHNGSAPDNLMIFMSAKANTESKTEKILPDFAECQTIVEPYIDEICRIKQLDKNAINTLAEINSSLGLVFNYDMHLNVLIVEELAEDIANPEELKNVIIICKSINKKIVKASLDDYIIPVEKLQTWHIEELIKQTCSQLNKQEIAWLAEATGKDLLRVQNELDKIVLFDENKQHDIFTALRYAPGSDLYACTIFELADAIIKRDRNFVNDYLLHRDCVDIDPVALNSNILRKISQLLILRDKDKIEQKRLMQIIGFANVAEFRNCTEQYLRHGLKFTAEFDEKLKSNLIMLTPDRMIDYVITGVMIL